MADTVQNFQINPDGSAYLEVVFDVTGLGLNPVDAQNYSPFTAPPQFDANNNLIPWTQATAQAALATEIANEKAAFLAAAPSFVPPPSTD